MLISNRTNRFQSLVSQNFRPVSPSSRETGFVQFEKSLKHNTPISEQQAVVTILQPSTEMAETPLTNTSSPGIRQSSELTRLPLLASQMLTWWLDEPAVTTLYGSMCNNVTCPSESKLATGVDSWDDLRMSHSKALNHQQLN